jgi:hypothetical protein
MVKTLRDIAPKKQVLGDVDGKLKGVKSSKTAPMNLDAWEKMPDSRDFIAKHEVETHADRVGNGDDVYKGKTKEAKYMRPSNEKLKNDPYDKNMGVYEAKEDDEDDEEDGEGAGDNENEDEDLDEASCNHTSEGVMCEVHGMKECNMESCDDKPMAGRNLKNKNGKQLLLDKSKKKMAEANMFVKTKSVFDKVKDKVNSPADPKSHITNPVQQIDEIGDTKAGRDTLKRYRYKAGDQATAAEKNMKNIEQRARVGMKQSPHNSDWDKEFDTAYKRRAGIEAATKRIDKMQESFAVYRKGGSVGELSGQKDYHPTHGKLIKTFDDKDEATSHAKSMNKMLSPGEKKYYRINYHVKPLNEDNVDEAWEVKHADGSVQNFNNQRDAYRAHQRSSGSTLGATHGAMGQKAASALGWDEYTKGRSEFKGPLRDEPKKTRREETVSEGKDSLYHVSWGTGVEHQVVAKHYDDAVSKAKDALMKKIPKLNDKKYSDTFSKDPTVHNVSKEKEAMKWQKHRLGEVVDMKDTGEVVHDFVHSKNPKFAGKSKAERIRMALGASYAAKRGTKKEDSGDNAANETSTAGPGAAGWTTGRMPTGTL